MSIYLPDDILKTADWMANNDDPNVRPRIQANHCSASAPSDQDVRLLNKWFL